MSGDKPKRSTSRKRTQQNNVPITFNIRTVDNRGSFKRNANHPGLLYLYTVLRWAVEGTYNQEGVHDAAQIIRKNDSALASVQAQLADGIESDSIAVFNVHSNLAIGRAEKESLVSHLRTMDVKSSVTSLVGENGLNYFLNGENLCHFLAEKFIPTDDDFQKGELWQNLIREVPGEWFTHSVQAEVTTAPAAKVATVERSITKQQVINAFDGLYLDRNGWNNALSDVPKWIAPCRVTRGRRGDKTTSATWNPVLIAAALIDKGISIKKLDAVFVRLPDWSDEWLEASENDR